VLASDRRNATSLLDPGGLTYSGTKFGVRTGASEKDAIAALKRWGFSDLNTQTTPWCMGRNLRTERTLFAYDRSWRNGIVCVGLDHGRVRVISWTYNFLAP